MLMNLKDWKQAVRTPPAYRVGNSTFRIQTQFVTIIAIVGCIALIVIYKAGDRKNVQKVVGYGLHELDKTSYLKSLQNGESFIGPFNCTYPLSKPLEVLNGFQFKIALVADLDQSSRSRDESNTWISYLLKGTLLWIPSTHTISISLNQKSATTLKSTFGHSGRGMELSELVTFDGKILSFDDRSGIVYVIENDHVYPWILLSDGSGKLSKGFKSEWATVKDEHLYVGSMGKEWTTSSGEFVNVNPMWVKKIDRHGAIKHLNWMDKYKALRSKLGIEFPGYMLHESGAWSDIHKRWFFLPRRMSKNKYNENDDEKMGTNVLLTADNNFEDIKVTYIGEVQPTHGFSSFKFIPGTKDEVIVALKTYEFEGQTATYIMAFTIQGKIITGETKIADFKYEGFEFI